MPQSLERILSSWPILMEATGKTLFLTFTSIIVGVVLALFLALGRISRIKPIKGFCWTYIWIFRGTPMLLQIYFIYFIAPKLFDNAFRMNEYFAAILALGLNSAAYLAEIIRAAIQSIDKGQLEASKALGMHSRLAMMRIIIPQSIRRMIPPVGNEFIMLLKDTSLVSAVSITELLRVTRQMTNSTGDPVYYLPAVVIYLFLTTIFTYVFEKLEKKYSIYE